MSSFKKEVEGLDKDLLTYGGSSLAQADSFLYHSSSIRTNPKLPNILNHKLQQLLQGDRQTNRWCRTEGFDDEYHVWETGRGMNFSCTLKYVLMYPGFLIDFDLLNQIVQHKYIMKSDIS